MTTNESRIASEKGNLITYFASCHCKRVAVEFQFTSGSDIEECNCSVCYQKGFLHMLVQKSAFKLICGDQNFSYIDNEMKLQEREDELMNIYQFGTKTAKHLSCRTCGISCYYYPRSHPEGVSINARCVEGGIPDTEHNITPFDGRNYEANLAALRAK